MKVKILDNTFYVFEGKVFQFIDLNILDKLHNL